MTNIITARGKTHFLRRGTYWHLTHARGAMLLHNAFNGQGVCSSISAVRNAGVEDAVTFYGFFNGSPEKEACWEAVRKSVDPELPTRLHALFFFDDETLAKRALQTWFAKDNRVLVEARIDATAKIHRADAALLDCTEGSWEQNAKRYWHAEMTDAPVPEVIVEGAAYFPGWQVAPFGFFAGLAPDR